MKTKLTLLFILLAAATVAGNAQYFVEGGFGVDFSGNKESIDVSPSETSRFSINFLPQVGYRLNDKIAVGIQGILSQNNFKRTGSVLKDKTSHWQISAFGRYKLWGTEKFSLLLDGSIYYREIKINRITLAGEQSDSYSRIGIDLVPAAIYNLTEKFSLITRFIFLNMELYSENGKHKGTVDGISVNNKSSAYSFVFSGSTLLTSLGNINIGFIYNF